MYRPSHVHNSHRPWITFNWSHGSWTIANDPLSDPIRSRLYSQKSPSICLWCGVWWSHAHLYTHTPRTHITNKSTVISFAGMTCYESDLTVGHLHTDRRAISSKWVERRLQNAVNTCCIMDESRRHSPVLTFAIDLHNRLIDNTVIDIWFTTSGSKHKHRNKTRRSVTRRRRRRWPVVYYCKYPYRLSIVCL